MIQLGLELGNLELAQNLLSKVQGEVRETEHRSALAAQEFKVDEKGRQKERELFQKQKEAHLQYLQTLSSVMMGSAPMELDESPSHTTTTTGFWSLPFYWLCYKLRH